MSAGTPERIEQIRQSEAAGESDFGYCDFNALLASIELAADASTDGLRDLAKAAPIPQRAPCASLAIRGAHRAIQAAINFLDSPKAAVTTSASGIAALNDKVEGVLRASGTEESRSPRGRSLRNHRAWAMCLALGSQNIPDAGLVVAGLLLLEAIHAGHRVPNKLAQDLTRDGWKLDLSTEALRTLLDSAYDAADTEWPWLGAVQRRWPSMLNLLCEGSVPPTPPGFNRRARGQLSAKAQYASPSHKAATPTHRHLSESQFRAACQQVGTWLKQGDWRGARAVVGAMSGLTIDLVPDIPIYDFVDEVWVCCLNIDAGLSLTDLSVIASEAAEAPTNGSAVPASYVNSKPFPEFLAEDLRRRRQQFPNAKRLGELYPEALSVSGYDAMVPSTHEIVISWARWISSWGLYARRAGLDNLLAALLSNDLGHIPRSKTYYALVRSDEIWTAAREFFDQCGWGQPAPAGAPFVAFGSRVVPRPEALASAIDWHRVQVERTRPARHDRSLSKLLEFHNAYTDCVAFELALMLALREGREYELFADIEETVDRWVELLDKKVPGPEGALPVALCQRARELIALYRAHCEAVSKRLTNLGAARCVFHAWLTGVVAHQRVPLLCHAEAIDRLRIAGSGGAFGSLPDDRAIAADAGRKFLENGLRHEGLRTGDIDAVLRHDVIGQSRSCSTSDFIVLEWAIRVGIVIDRITRTVLGSATRGLVQR